jgi:hypothetical protein
MRFFLFCFFFTLMSFLYIYFVYVPLPHFSQELASNRQPANVIRFSLLKAQPTAEG